MASRMSAIFKIDVNWLRGVYIAMFFCNAIFATMFKTIGRGERTLINLALSVVQKHPNGPYCVLDARLVDLLWHFFRL
ncbi:hypothetical protein GQ600_18013 [Phytophthora cactorum]|nr:hypothetical protein GQ600_18013 [Phytophthora cactorum]